MAALDVIAVFDIGKTNKKLLLFDPDYNIVYEENACFDEISDEEGDRCENLQSIEVFVFENLKKIQERTSVQVRALNFCTYGASFVHTGSAGKPLTVLYNYLKAYPNDLLRQFYERYGG